MDWLRSCYTVDMQFDAAGTIIRKVRWYFAADGALPVTDGFHLYGSANYSPNGQVPLGMGERWDSKRPWSNGATPDWATGLRPPCPFDVWWANGVPSNAPPLQLDGRGAPLCCKPPGYQGTLGIKPAFDTSTYGRCLPVGDLATAMGYRQDFGTMGGNTVSGRSATWVAVPSAVPQYLVAAWDGTGVFPFCLNVYYYVPFYGLNERLPFIGMSDHFDPPALYFGPQTHFPFASRYFYIQFFSYIFPVNIGLAMRPDGRARQRYPGALGGRAGVVSGGRMIGPGRLGADAGLFGAARSRRAGVLGADAGLASGGHMLDAAKLGAAAGIKSGGKLHGAGRLGGKGGIVSGGLLHGSDKDGGSVGLSSTTRTGIVTPCCPGLTVPRTLTATDGGGHTATATWSLAASGWSFIGPTDGFAWKLQCVSLGGGVFQWQNIHAQAGCSISHTVSGLSCSHPFAVTTTTSYSGGGCLLAGQSFTYSFSG